MVDIVPLVDEGYSLVEQNDMGKVGRLLERSNNK